MDQLTDKQLSIVRLLRDGLTQGTISRRLRISRASVSQTCTFLEGQNLIKKSINTRYNILYEISAELQKRIGGVQEQVSPIRVHNIAMKFHILKKPLPLSQDKRTGYQKSWFMRGKKEWSTYWYEGKSGEVSFTITAYPKTIKVQMDAGQKIIAKDHSDAEHKGFQQAVYARQKFIDAQRRFGVEIEIEPTGTKIYRAHGGLLIRENGPLDSETRIPGTWVDNSVKKEVGPGYKEFEMHTDHSLLTPLEQGVFAVAGLPDMIRNVINPIGADITAVKAMLQGGITQSQENDNIMKFLSAVLKEMAAMREEIRELKAKGIN